MSHPQAIQYIKNELTAGKSVDDIRESLLKANWDKQTVDDSLKEALNPDAYINQPRQYDHFLNPIELLQKSWEVFRSRQTTFLAFAFPLILISAITIFFTSTQPSSNTRTLTVLVLSLVNIVTSIITTVGLYIAIARRSEKITPIAAIESGVGKIPGYIAVNFLLFFVTFSASLFLLIPGIIIGVMVMFAPFIVLTENIGGMEALVRSRAYARGHILGLLGRVVFLVILCTPLIIIYLAIGDYINIIMPVVSVFISIYFYLMYENLRELRPNINSRQGGKTRTLFLILACAIPLLIPVFGVFSSIILLAINPAQLLRVSRDTTRLTNVNVLKTGVEQYYAENNNYPQSLDSLAGHIAIIPVDPKTNQPFEYRILPDGSGYEICATMEDKTKYPDEKYCVTNTSTQDLPQPTQRE